MRTHWVPLVLCLISATAAWSEESYSLLKPGDRPPALQFRTMDGETPNWADLAGKAVVLDFWATWCGPCLKAIPHLNALVDEFAGQPVRFISVTYEKEETVRPVLAKHPLRTAVALDDGCRTFRSFKAWGIPMMVLVGPDGIVKGVINPSELSSAVVSEVTQGRVPAVPQALPWKDPKGAEEYFCGTATQDGRP
jgi:thiol-disulfide isomerase/thioredoxin